MMANRWKFADIKQSVPYTVIIGYSNVIAGKLLSCKRITGERVCIRSLSQSHWPRWSLLAVTQWAKVPVLVPALAQALQWQQAVIRLLALLSVQAQVRFVTKPTHANLTVAHLRDCEKFKGTLRYTRRPFLFAS